MTSHAFCIFPSGENYLREEVNEILVTYLRVDLTKVADEVADPEVLMIDLNS